MTYLNNRAEEHLQFKSLLARVKDATMAHIKTLERPDLLTGVEFESIVCENTIIQAEGTLFEGLVSRTKDREFPDIIVAGLFGIEVKATKKDDWTSIGSSVLESARVSTVEEIYILFGKLGGDPDILYRSYENCLKGVSVTHYPRYTIDMKMDGSDSIFSKMDVSYDEMRKSSNPVKAIRTYYKQQVREGDSLWWIGDDIDDAPALSPIIKNFTSMDIDERQQIMADVAVFFPEIFSNSSKKFERVAAFLAAQHGVVASNFRDNFTAGGQKAVSYSGGAFSIPAMIGVVCALAPLIHNSLVDKDWVRVSEYWQGDVTDSSLDVEGAWMSEVDRHSGYMNLPVLVSDLYKLALRGELEML